MLTVLMLRLANKLLDVASYLLYKKESSIDQYHLTLCTLEKISNYFIKLGALIK